MNRIFARIPARTRFIIIAALSIYSILRGIRFPNIWSYTLYLFNYDQGFVKRGLIGSLVKASHISYLYSYEFFVIFSLVILFLCLWLILRIVYGSIKRDGNYIFWGAVLFSSSLSLVFLSHTVGYFDHIGLLVTLAVINTESTKNKFLLAFTGTLFCLFVHEAFLIIFFPTIFISLLITINQWDISKVTALLTYVVMTLIVSFFVTKSILPEKTVEASFYSTQANVPIPLRKDAYEVQYRNSDENQKIRAFIWSFYGGYNELLNSLKVTMPSAILLTILTISHLIRTHRPIYLIVLAVAASFSPLLLHWVALDVHRFNTLAILTAFLVLIAISSRSDNHTKENKFIDKSVFALIILCSLFNLFVSIPLFDSYKVKQFPFIEHLKYIHAALYEQGSLIIVPTN